MHEGKILVLVGMPGAGKSTCVDYLTAKGIPSVYFGGVIVDETRARFGRVSEELERQVREELRAKEGKGAVANRMITKIEDLFANGHSRVVADGLYSWTEYKIFKERWGNDAIMVAIAAPRRVRHERLANRPVRPFTDDEATAREYAEIENLEKGGPIANADYTLVNTSTPEELLIQFQAVLDEIDF
ncbi:MAG TPA: AAA family ATPase [Candidatus Saccharimonadales bacterium]